MLPSPNKFLFWVYIFKISRMMEDRKLLLHRIFFFSYFDFFVLYNNYGHKILSTIKIIKTILVEFFFFVTGSLIRFRLASPLVETLMSNWILLSDANQCALNESWKINSLKLVASPIFLAGAKKYFICFLKLNRQVHFNCTW
jgi:hypothetical protein